ncbi:MAG TPA: diadenylate cyclase CdaA [Thermoanaerobaculia bacterium]|nr:diadenylate cyclase CdaA [Thermoanaerobaculia bacterium]
MSLSDFFQSVGLRDVIDILAVALIVYNLLLLIRGTRAVQVLIGILMLVGVAFLARTFELETLEAVLNAFFIILPFAVIILFQNEIRRALTAFGKNPLNRLAAERQSGVQEIVHAATSLAAKKIGALIVVERQQGLREYIENGIVLDAALSFDLLLTIFNPSTPLHDGAVIVQDNRIAAASCFLPLSSNPGLSVRSGTRHRAALGITEETDALAVVVSEERGAISVAIAGQLNERLDGEGLRELLERHLGGDNGAHEVEAAPAKA